MDLNGKWVMLREDEAYEAGNNQVLEIDGAEVRSNRGAVGTVRANGDEIRIDLTPTDRLLFKNAAGAADDLSGLLYSSTSALPVGDPIKNEDDEDDEPGWWCDAVFLIRQAVAAERFKDGPSRYSTIDVSMYDLDTLRLAGFFDTENDADVATVLAKLPLVTSVLRHTG